MANQDSKPTLNQLSEEFMTTFLKRREELAEQISQLSPDDKSTLNDRLSNISAEIQKLNKTLHDAVMFLPSYSVKIRQNEIRELEKCLKDKEDTLIPKKRFGFKSKVQPSTNSVTNEDQSPADTQQSTENNPMLMMDNYFTIESVKNKTVIYNGDKLNGNDVMVKDSEDAIIILEGGPSTLRLANLKNCKLLCGPVRTSVFVDDVKTSTLFLCCQQLRTHTSEKVDIYLRVASRAIIEDCKQIRFGPYTWKHEKSVELHAKAEINVDLERFDAVDDFNWLSASPSPNWCVIPPEEWISFDFT